MPDLIISMTAPQAQRVAAALGDALNLGQPATMAEAKAFIIHKLKSRVINYERKQLTAAITEPTAPNIT